MEPSLIEPASAAAPFAYLDHAATTPMRPAAVEAMLPFLTEQFANPSGSHRASRLARQALDEARDVIAACLGAKPGEIVFTGCGTEADNAAVLGVIRRRGGTAVCTAAEHHAVLHPVEHLGERGRVIGVDRSANVDLTELQYVLSGRDVSLVSVMAVNNEVGSIAPIAHISRAVRTHAPTAVLHTDAVQAASWLDLAALTPLVDLMSLSAHKFGGPKGVGVLWVRDGVRFEPLLQGGGQERDRRSGTHNVAGIVATAEALRVTCEQRTVASATIGALRDRLCDGLLAACPGSIETIERANKVAGSAHMMFPSCESEAVLFLLDQAGVCASAASACASGAMEPSHVLAAMGVPREHAMGAIRFSLGFASTDADIDLALAVLPAIIERCSRR